MQDLGYTRVCIRRKNWKWIALFSSSLLWLLLGSLGSVILTQVPEVGKISPNTISRQFNLVVDLGINPVWVARTSLSIVEDSATNECSGSALYIVRNSTCDLLPTMGSTTYMLTYLYLLPDSYYNVTIRQEVDLDGIFLWIVKSADRYDSLTSSHICSNISETERCYMLGNGFAGVTLPLYEVSSPDYYFIFTNKRGVHNFATYTIYKVEFNMSAILDLYSPTSVQIGPTPKPAEISSPFSFDRHAYCLILSTGCPTTQALYKFVSDISRRVDIELSPFVVGFFFFLLHLVISICIWRCTPNNT